MMKKILLVATSMVALSGMASVAAADHNYVGMGLGWTTAKMKHKGSANKPTVAAFTNSFSKTLSDSSAVSGTLSFGRTFDSGDVSWLAEGKFGLDSTNATETHGTTFPGAGAGLSDFRTNLKRKGTLGLSVGASKNFSPVSLYTKLSLLYSKFEYSHTETYLGATPALGGDTADMTSQKKFGLGIEVGATKPLTSDVSLGIGYIFERYQTVKHSMASFTTPGGAFNPRANYTARTKPTYHTVMATLTKTL